MNSMSVSTPMVTNPTVSFPTPYSKIASTSSRRSASTLPVRATVSCPRERAARTASMMFVLQPLCETKTSNASDAMTSRRSSSSR